MPSRGHPGFALALGCGWFWAFVGCSTAGAPSATPEGGAVGPTESACAVQGYFDETDGGQCPGGTCQVLAFDTNGGRLACCTSVVSGPGICADAGTATGPDADAGD